MFRQLIKMTASAACALLATLLGSSLAWAFFVSVEVVGKVARGQAPKLVLTGVESADDVVVELKRDDGKTFSFPLGQLAADGVREVPLDARLGRRRYEGAIKARVGGEQVSSDLSFETVVAAPIEIKVDRAQLDLDRRTLSFMANVPLAAAQLSVVDVDGHTFFDQRFELDEVSANKPITLRWKGGSADGVMRLELRVEDSDGFFKAVALAPWSVTIPHEEVLFPTNSAEIGSAEVRKLEKSLEEVRAALARFHQIQGVQLFIAGHTDTVGKPAHNAHLSRLRAQAIGQWFVAHDVPIPVYFEGFGEASPKVKTADEVDEPQNRRVDYILAVEPPTLRGQAHGWKRLK